SVLPASKKTARITSLSLPGPGARHPPGYTSRVYALGLAVRFIHLAGIILLVGAAATLLLAGRSDRPTALRWESRVLALSCAVAVLTLAAGLAARRFSRAALVCVLALVLTGTLNAATQVATVAGLVGTTYGRLLLVKLALLLPILALAAVNRRRHLPRLGGDGATVGRPAMRRLARFVGWEAALALLLLAVVAVMSATPPARHEAPDWPFAFRLTTASLDDAPALRARALVGSQMALLGLVGLLVAVFVGAGRLALAGGALVVLAAGAALALPALAVDAYP